MPPNGPDNAKRNHGHDDQRLTVGRELNGQQHKGRQHRNGEADHQALDGLRILFLLSFPADLQIRIAVQQIGNKGLLQSSHNFLGIRDCFIHICRNGD